MGRQVAAARQTFFTGRKFKKNSLYIIGMVVLRAA